MSYFVLKGASQRTKSFTSFALAALMVFQAFGPGLFALKIANATQASVTICHATASANNPYVSQSPNIQNDGSLAGGHLNHTGPVYPTANWGDIIPPYVSGNFNFPGLNWTTEGQAIYNNGCNPVVVIVDLCLNIDGVQATVPDGYTANDGNCTQNHPPVDVCNNIQGDQATIPENMISDGHGGCVPHGDPQETPHATITATKIVCDTETVLPNWGAGGPDITSTTATDFLAEHSDVCHKEAWNFAWSEDGVGNPGDEVLGAGGAGWNAFADSVPTSIPAGKRIWFREQFQNGYIPFTGQNTNEDISAEIYCGSDVLHYDNWEYIDTSADHPYHCVAWNVELPGTPEEIPTCLMPVTLEGGTKVTTFGASTDGENKQLQNVLDEAGYSINTLTEETGYQVWNVPANTTSVTISAKFIKAIAGNVNTFGYYVNGDISTFVPVFVSSVNVPGALSGPIVIDTTGVTSIGFAIKSTGGSTKVFATQFAPAISGTDNSGEDHAVVYSPAQNTYVLGFEDINPLSSSDNDYQDMVAEIHVDSCSTGITPCVTSGKVSSGTDTQVTEINPVGPAVPFGAFAVSSVPAIQALGTGVWGATTIDPSAIWIWSEDPVSNWTADKTVTFTKSFTITGTPTAGSLQIAADNSYEVWVNGQLAGSDASEDNHSSADTIDVLSKLQTGPNTLVIKVKNFGLDVPFTNNPGGLLYTLSWNSNCEDTPPTDGGTGTLKIKKVLIDANEGVEVSDFAFILDGADPVYFEDSGVKNVIVSVGPHTVVEFNANTGGFVTTYSEDCTTSIAKNELKTCVITNTYDPEDNGGGGGGGGDDTPTTESTPTGGSGSRSGQQRGGSVAGASTNVPQVLGASTDVPSMPDTGNGAESNTLVIALSIFGALVAVNAIAIRKMRNS